MIANGAPGDEGAMGQILSDWIDDTDWMPRLHTRAQDRAFCQSLLANTTVFTAQEAGDVVGFLALEPSEIPALYIAKTARRRGHGKALLDAAKQEALSFTLWTFQQNTAARQFYDREGLIEAMRTDGERNDENLPDLQLSWSR